MLLSLPILKAVGPKLVSPPKALLGLIFFILMCLEIKQTRNWMLSLKRNWQQTGKTSRPLIREATTNLFLMRNHFTWHHHIGSLIIRVVKWFWAPACQSENWKLVRSNPAGWWPFFFSPSLEYLIRSVYEVHLYLRFVKENSLLWCWRHNRIK